ncbi:acyl-CoA synthetase [Streptomyces rugosispiralis]|uniref:Acyl-CoA synthetase n=1 Tax=Streptomyces rugosispiralis TaxID=2967341 RepID=A0ABT1UTI2_9ACTN|nr:acyl-CoA synthetase [Streptomyces rugosispiralis]MCQ8188420.1 acyl-CoA synthetase [Streptomyces rugosispiralis]
MTASDLPVDIVRARRHGIADLLARTAARLPARTAVVEGPLRQTYAELDALVSRTAGALAARGIAQGDRVVLFARNSHGFVVAYFALARLGAVSVPVNFMLTTSEVAYVLDHSGAVGIVAGADLLDVAEGALAEAAPPRMALRAALGGRREGWEEFAALGAEDGHPVPDPALEDDDPVQLMYTSGTESRPKGAIMTSRNLIAQYQTAIVDGGMSADDVEIHALPLYHCAQLHAFLTPDIQLGATCLVLPGPDPATLLATIEAERVTKLFAPPTVWIALLRHPEFDSRDLSSLRKGYYGAAPMPVAVLAELRRRLPGLALYNFYGQTEMSPIATVLGPADQERKAGSAGRAALNVETRVVDEEDRPVEPGTVGEIAHRGPHTMLGYWRDPERTAEAFRGGWFHSGDLGVLDEEGFLTIVDRKKDMVNSGGENVSGREVEEAVHAHPAVAEVAVFGVPHPYWIEAVTAVVVAKPGHEVTAEEILTHCRARLAGFKVPKFVRFTEALPKNPSGKILKRELREIYRDMAEEPPGDQGAHI